MSVVKETLQCPSMLKHGSNPNKMGGYIYRGDNGDRGDNGKLKSFTILVVGCYAYLIEYNNFTDEQHVMGYLNPILAITPNPIFRTNYCNIFDKYKFVFIDHDNINVYNEYKQFTVCVSISHNTNDIIKQYELIDKTCQKIQNVCDINITKKYCWYKYFKGQDFKTCDPQLINSNNDIKCIMDEIISLFHDDTHYCVDEDHEWKSVDEPVITINMESHIKFHDMNTVGTIPIIRIDSRCSDHNKIMIRDGNNYKLVIDGISYFVDYRNGMVHGKYKFIGNNGCSLRNYQYGKRYGYSYHYNRMLGYGMMNEFDYDCDDYGIMISLNPGCQIIVSVHDKRYSEYNTMNLIISDISNIYYHCKPHDDKKLKIVWSLSNDMSNFNINIIDYTSDIIIKHFVINSSATNVILPDIQTSGFLCNIKWTLWWWFWWCL